MKTTILKMFSFLVLFIYTISYTQDYFYNTNAESFAVVGSESYLVFDQPKPVHSDTKSIGFDDFLVNNLTTFVGLGYDIIQNQIDRDQMKYTDSFSVRRTYLFEEPIKGFTIRREIIGKSTKKRETAFEAHFNSKKIFGNSLVFQLDKIFTNYSGAKVWEKTNFNAYDIKIYMSYFSGGEAKVKEFKTVKIPLVGIGNPESVPVKDENGCYKYQTELFVLPDDFVLLDVHVFVDETSASKYKAERIKRIKDNYAPDAKDFVEKFIIHLQKERALRKAVKEAAEDSE